VTPEQWEQVWAVFQATAELPPARRNQAIESALPDFELRAKVDELLADLAAGSETSKLSEATEAPKPAPEWPRLGQTLGRFELRRALGRGGMGEVYGAFDPELQREVAIKCVAPANLGSSNAIADFLREARAASALNHPGIVTVYEIIRTDDAVAIVMELVEGESFRKFAASLAPQAPARVAEWGRQIAEALAASHARGIIHRDIKPENLILRNDGYAKILDFGLAADRAVRADSLPMGTVRYMSPEQSRAAVLTPASDIFSLGVVLFEMATGVHPFAAAGASDTTLSMVQAIGGCDLDRAAQFGVTLPPKFERLLRSMMAKEPELRPTAKDVAAQFAALGDASATKPVRSWRFIAAMIGAAVIIAATSIAARTWLPARSVPIDPASVQISPFTTYEGSATQPAFSPDGSKIAFVWTGKSGNNEDIYVKAMGPKDLSEDVPQRLTSDPNEDLLPSFSPDGKQIAFLRQSAAPSDPEVMVMQADGSGARALGRVAASFGFYGLTWWPDGKSLVVRDADDGGTSLFRMSLEDGSKQRITTTPEDEGDGYPRFSPDGKWLAFIRYEASGEKICIREPAARSSERCLVDSMLSDIAWTVDSRNILYNGAQGLWRVNIEGGPHPEKVLAGNFSSLTADRSGHRFAFTRSYSDLNVWRADRSGKANRLIASSGEDSSPGWSPDGKRIVVRSNRSGSFELYTYAADGSDEKQITHFGAHIDNPRWSPDGAWIAFDGNRSAIDSTVKHHNIYLVPSAGGAVRRITDDATHYEEPAWSADGRWIYYLRSANTEATWKVPFAGGAPVLVDSQPMQDLVESPDGQYLYYVRYNDSSGIRRRRIADGKDETLPGTEGVQLFRYWSLAGDGIYFIPGPPNVTLRFLNLRTRKISRIASIPSKLYKGPRGLAASPDGNWVLYTLQDVVAGDIMLATIP
jgi:eukaryotic-like serine/threonine-protein kinase